MMMGQGLSQGASLDSRVKTGVLERLESLVAEQAKINLEREKAESALYAQRELCSAMLLWQEHAHVARRVRGAACALAGAWTEPHDRLVATIPPGFLLQAAWPFDAEFKIYIAWGRFVSWEDVLRAPPRMWFDD